MRNNYENINSHLSSDLSFTSFVDEPTEPAMIFLEELELPYYVAAHQLQSGKEMGELYKHFIINDGFAFKRNQN